MRYSLATRDRRRTPASAKNPAAFAICQSMSAAPIWTLRKYPGGRPSLRQMRPGSVR